MTGRIQTISAVVGIIILIDNNTQHEQGIVIEICRLILENVLIVSLHILRIELSEFNHITLSTANLTFTYHDHRQYDRHQIITNGGIITSIHQNTGHTLQSRHGGEHGIIIVIILAVILEGSQQHLQNGLAHSTNIFTVGVDQGVECLHDILHRHTLQHHHISLDDVLERVLEEIADVLHVHVGLERNSSTDHYRQFLVIQAVDDILYNHCLTNDKIKENKEDKMAREKR